MIRHTLPADVAPNPDFAGPARGGDWQPDYSKYAPALAHQVKQAVERP